MQNALYIWAGKDGLVAATVGEELIPRPTGEQNERLSKLLKRWIKVCDADGGFDLFS